MATHTLEPFTKAELDDFLKYAKGQRILKYIFAIVYGVITIISVHLLTKIMGEFAPLLVLLIIWGIIIATAIWGAFFLWKKFGPLLNAHLAAVEKDLKDRQKEVIRGPIQKKWIDTTDEEDASYYITIFGEDFEIERRKYWNNLREGQHMIVEVSKHARYRFSLTTQQ